MLEKMSGGAGNNSGTSFATIVLLVDTANGEEAEVFFSPVWLTERCSLARHWSEGTLSEEGTDLITTPLIFSIISPPRFLAFSFVIVLSPCLCSRLRRWISGYCTPGC